MSVIHRSDNVPFITKDGSIIRELMRPLRHGSRNQSLAEAVVLVGMATQLHQHGKSEEIYHIVAGEGRMTLAQEVFTVRLGDTVCILPGTPHKITNTGTADLRILCCCAPAYLHNDTELLD